MRVNLAVSNQKAIKEMEQDYEAGQITDQGVAKKAQELYHDERRQDSSYDSDEEQKRAGNND